MGKKWDWKQSVILYLAVWTGCVLWFWLGRGGGGWIMSYTILVFMVILPITALVSSFLLEWRRDLGNWRWAVIGGSGAMYLAAILATFSLSTALEMANIAPLSPSAALPGAVSSAIGIGLGWLVRTGKVGLRAPATGFALLLAFCYVQLKGLGGSLLRPLPILDVPALLLLLLGLWLAVRAHKAKSGK